MLVTLVIAPMDDVAPEDRIMTVSPFDITAITPIEYFPVMRQQYPEARAVVRCDTALVMGNCHIPVTSSASQMMQVWNRAIREYAAAMPAGKNRTIRNVD